MSQTFVKIWIQIDFQNWFLISKIPFEESDKVHDSVIYWIAFACSATFCLQFGIQGLD